MNKAKIIGTGHHVPPFVVTNDDLAKIIDTSDEWIKTRTGIRERRISKGEGTSYIATQAAIKALEDAEISPEEIDFIIVATYTSDELVPSTACTVQGNIGAVNATCFDLSAACTGFLYSLDIATQFIRSGRAKCVLVIGAETQSKMVNWEDRATCVLFGDGAGAAILKASTEGKGDILASYTGCEGDKRQNLIIKGFPMRNPFIENGQGKMYDLTNSTITMDGKEIFKFAVRVMIQCAEELLKISGLSMDDIKFIIPHQANYRIIESTAKKLGVDMDKIFVDIDKYGNTSAASMGIALDELAKSGCIERGDKIMLIGFGGGLGYGGVIIEW